MHNYLLFIDIYFSQAKKYLRSFSVVPQGNIFKSVQTKGRERTLPRPAKKKGLQKHSVNPFPVGQTIMVLKAPRHSCGDKVLVIVVQVTARVVICILIAAFHRPCLVNTVGERRTHPPAVVLALPGFQRGCGAIIKFLREAGKGAKL